MKASIHSIVEYMSYGWVMYNVYYESGRMFVYELCDLPTSARKFIRSSTHTTLIHENRGKKYAKTMRRYEA